MSERPESPGHGGPPGEDRLHAYVDGHLDPAQRQAVEAWLADHPQDAAKVADWQAQLTSLHAAFDPVLAAPLPERLHEAARRKPLAPVLTRLAACVALLALGGGAGWFAATQMELRHVDGTGSLALVDNAVAAYRIYTVEVRHPVEVGASEEPHLVAWLSKRLGSPIVAPDLASLGYNLVGGRLLPGAHGPAAMLMYEGRDGRRITAYIAANRENRETAFQFREANGVGVFYWLDGPLGYALTGEADRAQLLAVARAIYRQLEP